MEAAAKAQAANVTASRATADSANRMVEQRKAQLQEAQSRLSQYRSTATQLITIREASLHSQQANSQSAEAQVEQARLNLAYTKITAPFDGIVMKRPAEVGARVSPGQQLITIAQTSDIWVTANFKETQLSGLLPKQPATIHVDALDRDFDGYVETIGGATGAIASVLPPENATGNYVKVVQRIPVRLRFKPNQSGRARCSICATTTPATCGVRRPCRSATTAPPMCARHGWGYSRFEHAAHGIAAELLQYVPLGDPIKISRLTLHNTSGRDAASFGDRLRRMGAGSLARRLRAVRVDRDRSRHRRDVRAQSVASRPSPRGAPCRHGWAADPLDRRSPRVLGRNGSLRAAALALIEGVPLSGRLGAGLDPCAAVQTTIHLAPGESVEVPVFMGDAADRGGRAGAGPGEFVRRTSTKCWRTPSAAGTKS